VGWGEPLEKAPFLIGDRGMIVILKIAWMIEPEKDRPKNLRGRSEPGAAISPPLYGTDRLGVNLKFVRASL
jgi:hypothetical protein